MMAETIMDCLEELLEAGRRFEAAELERKRYQKVLREWWAEIDRRRALREKESA